MEIVSLWVAIAAALPLAVGIMAWVIALGLAPVARPRRFACRRSLVAVGLVVAFAACCVVVWLVSAGRELVALPVAGVGMTASAAVFFLLWAGGGWRGGGQDDDAGGRPPPGGGDDEPSSPGGDGVDWDGFEREFWAHVDRERSSGCAPS